MPIRNIAGTTVQYYLISFDKNGIERPETDGSMLSETVKHLVADPAQGITDVFFASHGWKGDVPAAIDQYDRWVGEMARSPDHAAAAASRPGFRALVVGLHWPSLPFGDEDQPEAGGLLSAGSADDVDAEVEQYAASIAETPEARSAIRTILSAARRGDGEDEHLSADVRHAYESLYAEAGLGGDRGDPADPPGADHDEWDADAIFVAAREAGGAAGAPGLLGGGVRDKLKDWVTAPLRQLSFWKMKDRARHVGETGGHALLQKLQASAPPTTRFHLMGHSFGCIVVSATVAGPPGKQGLARPVDSLFLVQGALSLWSYCADIPFARGKAGYFNRMLKQVRGPVVTTRSTFDNAVGKLYPSAADLANQLVLAAEEFPKYGGVGTFGAQGLGGSSVNLVMGPVSQRYDFAAGSVYNLEASGIIRNGGGFSGAHSDIAHPEVAHAMWAAVLR